MLNFVIQAGTQGKEQTLAKEFLGFDIVGEDPCEGQVNQQFEECDLYVEQNVNDL